MKTEKPAGGVVVTLAHTHEGWAAVRVKCLVCSCVLNRVIRTNDHPDHVRCLICSAESSRCWWLNRGEADHSHLVVGDWEKLDPAGIRMPRPPLPGGGKRGPVVVRRKSPD
ncbi:MAG: hypothetical protein JWN04_2925 [Myxococcaceae bacterium]|nr:hypothetical protein [Myxococcaceae bacterium]